MITESVTYTVRNLCGDVINPGDTIKDFRGDTATFIGVTRGTEFNGTAKVLVHPYMSGIEREFYATVYALTVTTNKNG